MDYRAAVDYLITFADFERSSGLRRREEAFALDRITSLLRRLERPQDGRLTVHVAGSKGKGSTAAMIEAGLRAAGLRTGLFTSPHLHEFTERIRINGEPLPPPDFAAALEGLQSVIREELAADPGRLSTFEILTALGFQAFRNAALDVQVVEVGLGGRLDSTNVFRDKAVAVVTALSREHTHVLGSDLSKIAWEKAGIITAGTRAAVLGPQRSEAAASTVREYAEEMHVPLWDVSARSRWEPAGAEAAGQWFRLTRVNEHGAEQGDTLYLTPLLGLHQIENAATAISALEALRQQGVEIPSAALHTGLATVSWLARLEAVGRDPWVVVDGAHNAESLDRVLESLPAYFPHERLIVVLGTLRDKEAGALAERLQTAADVVVLTQPDHPRARPAADLAQMFTDWDGTVDVQPQVADAVDAAKAAAGPRDLVCVLGSLFVAAAARAHIRQQAGQEPTSAWADR